jgi:ATP-dependent Lon protease
MTFSPPISLTGYRFRRDEREVDVLMRSLLTLFDQYVKLNKKVPPEILTSLSGIDEPGRLADTIAAHMSLKIEEKQRILEIEDVRDRLEHLMGMIEGEIDVLQIEKRIRGRVKQQMEKSQREYYLNEQMKAIQKELGELEDVPNEVEELEQKIEKAGMSKEAKTKAMSELNKLKMMSPMSAEATVVRNYIDWLVSVPWKKRTKILHDLARPSRCSKRITMAWRRSRNASSNTSRCSSGSRSSRARSCAWWGRPASARPRWAVHRPRHQPQVRAHGPGRRARRGRDPRSPAHLHRLPAGQDHPEPVQGGVRNPLFLLDEIDKMSMDFRGDPSSACSRCWIRSRTTPSATTTWRWTSTCRM